jgi:hypothetical protein
MPWKDGTTVAEARQRISDFLQEAGCYDICAKCPVYPGGEGCCYGCPNLMKGVGCSTPNLSCLSYTCGVLNEHLRRQDKLDKFTEMIYGISREGYRGCQRRGDSELLQIIDPLEEIGAEIRIPSDSVKEDVGG